MGRRAGKMRERLSSEKKNEEFGGISKGRSFIGSEVTCLLDGRGRA